MRKELYEDKVLDIVCNLFIYLFAIACLFPFLLVITSSITEETSLMQYGYSLIPKRFSLDAYRVLMQTDRIYNGYKTTVFITVVGTILSMFFSCAFAYAISVKSLKYRNQLAFFVYFTMLFHGGLVPMYILISKYLHMNNNIWVLIIPILINPWNMFLLRNFFSSIPDALAESAKIDGANDILIMIKIILPVSLPAIATVGLFYALAYWNEWFRCMLFITDKHKYTLQYLIMDIQRNIEFINELAAITGNSAQTNFTPPSYTSRMATTVVTIGPIIFVYPFIQKYFVKGLMVGAIKG